jgi:hypothetical protein
MSTDSTQATLAERVFAILAEEREGGLVGPLAVDRCEAEPHDDGHLSEREQELRCWGLAYGLAFGVLMSEVPAPSELDRERLADVALDAARAAFARWSGEITPRPVVSPLVDAVLLAFEDAGKELDRMRGTEKEAAVGPLVERLESLREAVGTPARERVTA